MDINEMFLNVLDAGGQIFNILTRKPFLTVKVDYAAPANGTAEPSLALTIANESSFDMEAHRVWFLTTYNRIVPAGSLEAGFPVKLPENERATFTVPAAELKAALNRAAGDAIGKVVVLDDRGHQHAARLSLNLQKKLFQ